MKILLIFTVDILRNNHFDQMALVTMWVPMLTQSVSAYTKRRLSWDGASHAFFWYHDKNLKTCVSVMRLMFPSANLMTGGKM